MDDSLDLSELREAIRGALKDRELLIPDEQGHPADRALWKEMAALGWLGLGVSAAHGGLGQTFAHLAVLHEELGRIVASTPTVTTLAAVNLVAARGSAALQARILPAIAAGDLMVGIADPDRCTAVVRDGRISGVAKDVLFAAEIDLLLIPVEAGYVAIQPSQEGVAIAVTPTVDLTRRAGVITLDGAAFNKDGLILLNATDRAALQNELAVAIACDSIGGAQEVFARTIEYLGIREQFGRPIGSFQALKHRAAHWKVQLEAGAALVRQAATSIAAGEEDASSLASSAKFYVCDLYAAVAEDAIQLHGGIGFTWEHPCHLFLKRAKLSQVLFGGTTTHKERVASLAFGGNALAAPPGEG